MAEWKTPLRGVIFVSLLLAGAGVAQAQVGSTHHGASHRVARVKPEHRIAHVRPHHEYRMVHTARAKSKWRADSSVIAARTVTADSLTPGALQLMHLSPVQFAGVGAAPQSLGLQSFPFHFVDAHPAAVSDPQFIDQSLILARGADDPAVVDTAPVSPLPVAVAIRPDLAPKDPSTTDAVAPGDEETSSGSLGLALTMLASQAYQWASHPLEALSQSGEVAEGEHAARELRNDIALAAQSAAAPDGSGDSWLSPRGLVRTALHFIGAPYRWGGVSPISGFDCSGFVKYILAKFDIQVPRTSYAQAAALPAIPESRLKPGDLVFFNTMHRAYSHVGIYIGHDHFVSAQTPSTGVRVASLDDPYWAARFDGARRLPKDIHFS